MKPFYFLSLIFLALSTFSTQSFSTPLENDLLKTQDRAVVDDLTIVVSSCDKYAECWKPFCELLMRYWPSLKTYNNHIRIILITNNKPFSFPGVNVFQTGKDKSWSDNMLEVLKTVKTKYVLYLQEDYMMSEPIKEARIKELLDGIKEGKAVYIQLNNDGSDYKNKSPYNLLPGTRMKAKHTGYRPALQSALWEKNTFGWLIKSGESPWQFESEGGTRSQGIQHPFLYVFENHPIQFVNACHLGYWEKKALDFLEKEGFPIKNTLLPIDTDYPFSYWLLSYSYRTYTRIWLPILKLIDPKFN